MPVGWLQLTILDVCILKHSTFILSYSWIWNVTEKKICVELEAHRGIYSQKLMDTYVLLFCKTFGL